MKTNILLLILLITFIGCTAEAELTVHNDTNGFLDVEIDGDEYELDAGEIQNKSWELTSSLIEIEEKDVLVTGEGLFKFEFSDEYTVEPEDQEDVYINDDAGAFKLMNNSGSNIVEVYISPGSDEYWGDNVLSGYIVPGEVMYWRLTAGYWDVKAVGEQGNIGEKFDNYVSIGSLLELYFTTVGKSVVNSGIKVKDFDPKYMDQTTEYRCAEYQFAQ